MKNKKLKIKTNKRKGFTLLLSLLVISIILSVSFGVFDVMTKELKLSGIGRESQISFYAADAGIECAYFWDIKHPGLTESAFDLSSNNIGSVKCGGTDGVSDEKFDNKTSSFSFNMGENGGSNQKCAKVKVTKVIGDPYVKESKSFVDTTTTIESKGYNYPCISNSSHKVERAIRVISTKTEEVGV